jgi:hypothetical protein
MKGGFDFNFNQLVTGTGGGGGGGGTGLTPVTTRTSNYTMGSNQIIPIDSSGGSFTVFLPASPANGDQIYIFDSGGALSTNSVTLDRNGKTINGAASNVILNVDYVIVLAIYDSTNGWTVS